MKKGDKISLIDEEISQINHLIKVLGRYMEKFEAAYTIRDHKKFNSLKRDMIWIQRKIHSLVK